MSVHAPVFKRLKMGEHIYNTKFPPISITPSLLSNMSKISHVKLVQCRYVLTLYTRDCKQIAFLFIVNKITLSIPKVIDLI